MTEFVIFIWVLEAVEELLFPSVMILQGKHKVSWKMDSESICKLLFYCTHLHYLNKTHCLDTHRKQIGQKNRTFFTFAIIHTSLAEVRLRGGNIRLRWGELRNCMEGKPHLPFI